MFSCSCSRQSFSSDERDKVTGFFEKLILEHGGAYTLFGSKPITIESLIDISEENLQKIREWLLKHPEIETVGEVERKLEEGWDIWKKRKQFSLRFILREIDLDGDQMLVFMNTQMTEKALLKDYETFRQIVGKDFDAKQEIAAFRSGLTPFWQKLLLDYKAKGILFGYGYRNASLFLNECGKSGYRPSENNDPRLQAECVLNDKPFRIPIFVMFDKSESQKLIKQYKKEREEIKKVYEDRDFLTVTLNELYRASS